MGVIRRSIISLQARLSVRVKCKMSKRLACLREWLIARDMAVAVRLAATEVRIMIK